MTKIDASDIEIIYETNVDKIYRFFYYKGLNKEMAEDLTSEVFMTFVKRIKTKNDVDDPKNFLYGIAKNIFLKYLKQKYDKPTVTIDDMDDFSLIVQKTLDEFDEEEDEEKEERNIDIIAKKYIKQLPEKQQIILHMRLVQKLPLGIICDKLGKDMNYVKTTQRRGIKKLRQLLECTL